jgi:RNA polymerase sigma factor (sigma-70 family)
VSDDPDRRIDEAVERERSRLRNFVRRRVRDAADAEDIVQEVFARLVAANRLLMPVDHVTGWVYRVARNLITDLLRRPVPVHLEDIASSVDGGERLPARYFLRLTTRWSTR